MDPVLAQDEVDAWLDVLTLIETYTPDVNREWKQYTNSEGRHYYYKLSNGEVTWNMPTGFLTRQQMANIMSQYFVLLAKGLSKDSTTSGVPFVQPAYPADPPPHDLLMGSDANTGTAKPSATTLVKDRNALKTASGNIKIKPDEAPAAAAEANGAKITPPGSPLSNSAPGHTRGSASKISITARAAPGGSSGQGSSPGRTSPFSINLPTSGASSAAASPRMSPMSQSASPPSALDFSAESPHSKEFPPKRASRDRGISTPSRSPAASPFARDLASPTGPAAVNPYATNPRTASPGPRVPESAGGGALPIMAGGLATPGTMTPPPGGISAKPASAFATSPGDFSKATSNPNIALKNPLLNHVADPSALAKTNSSPALSPKPSGASSSPPGPSGFTPPPGGVTSLLNSYTPPPGFTSSGGSGLASPARVGPVAGLSPSLTPGLATNPNPGLSPGLATNPNPGLLPGLATNPTARGISITNRGGTTPAMGMPVGRGIPLKTNPSTGGT